jgi:hypothetical protein
MVHFQKYKVPIISPLIGLIKKYLPNKITTYPMRITASGMTNIAKK